MEMERDRFEEIIEEAGLFAAYSNVLAGIGTVMSTISETLNEEEAEAFGKVFLEVIKEEV